MTDTVTFTGGPTSAKEVIQWAAEHGWHAWWSGGLTSANRGGWSPENVQIDDDSMVVPAVYVGGTASVVDGHVSVTPLTL